MWIVDGLMEQQAGTQRGKASSVEHGYECGWGLEWNLEGMQVRNQVHGVNSKKAEGEMKLINVNNSDGKQTWIA